MSTKTPIKVVLGAANFGTGTTGGATCVSSTPVIQSILDEFKAHHHDTLDNARGYGEGTSESILAEMNYADQGFIMDTKIRSKDPGSHSRVNLFASLEASLKALNADSVNVLYLHMPDRATPFEETLAVIDEAYKLGKFKRFGISNYSPEEVEQMVKIAKEKGYIQPTVYQGMYNLLVRGGEEKLFPVLRKYGISFYAFSPLGGGFLTSSISADHQAAPNTRFDDNTRIGTFYKGNYFKPSYFQALDKLKKVAEENSMTVPEVALRWIANNSFLSSSYGDAVLTSAFKLDNFKNSLDYLERGPLPEPVLKVVNEMWEVVKDDAAQFHR